MITRFLVWMCLLIQRVITRPTGNIVNQEVPETLQRLEKIKARIVSTPEEVKGVDSFNKILFSELETKFKDVGQLFDCLHTFKTALGEQILDPAVSKPIEADCIEFSRRGYKTIMLAYFQTQNGRDVPLKVAYPALEKYVSELIQLYTLLIYHPDIDEEYLPYLDRRINPLLKELEIYTESIYTLGNLTHV